MRAAVLQREHHLADVDRVVVLGELRRGQLALLEIGDVLRQSIDDDLLLAGDHGKRGLLRGGADIGHRIGRLELGQERHRRVDIGLTDSREPTNRVDPDPAAVVLRRLDQERDALLAEQLCGLDDGFHREVERHVERDDQLVVGMADLIGERGDHLLRDLRPGAVDGEHDLRDQRTDLAT